MDQFYTKTHVASYLLEKVKQNVDIDAFDILFEPSAGKGSFFHLFDEEKRIGIDIDPKGDDIEKMNFFDYEPIPEKKYISIGNPPFGKNGKLCIKFFNHCSKFCDCIAFVVPRTFKRVSVQNKLNLHFHLIFDEDLPLVPCCFEPKLSAKCCFQIWMRCSSDNQRHKIKYDSCHSDFTFLKYGPKDERLQPTPPTGADFAMKAYGSHCGQIVSTNLQTLRPKSWHWIKANIDKEILKSRFSELDYSMSKDTVRQDSLGQQELVYLYKKKIYP